MRVQKKRGGECVVKILKWREYGRKRGKQGYENERISKAKKENCRKIRIKREREKCKGKGRICDGKSTYRIEKEL